MLRMIGAALVREGGHEVNVFASVPSYRPGVTAERREMLDGMSVHRCFAVQNEKTSPLRRMFNLAYYCAALFFHILKTRPDVVTVSTYPPVVAAWMAHLSARLCGAKLVYHMQDIHPELSHLSGGHLGHGLLYRILSGMDQQTCRNASAIVTLSEDMADTLKARPAPLAPIHLVNNFSLDPGRLETKCTGEAPHKEKITAIFAGNLGNFQELPLLTRGVAQCFDRYPNLELLFLGDGTAKAELFAHWGRHPQVRFLPFLPFEEARPLIASADIGLVSLLPRITQVAFPSKVQTYLSLNLPILALVDSNSHLASEIRTGGYGVVPENRTEQAISTAMVEIIEQKEIMVGQIAPVLRKTTPDYITSKWVSLMSELAPR